MRGRNIDWNQLGFIKRSNRVDTHLMLMIADAADLLKDRYSQEQLAELFAVPGQGGVSPKDRLREIQQVREFWPGDILMGAVEFKAPWHSLVEVAHTDGVDKETVFTFVDDYITRKHAWPKVDDIRRLIGRAPTTRLPGEQEGQGALL